MHGANMKIIIIRFYLYTVIFIWVISLEQY